MLPKQNSNRVTVVGWTAGRTQALSAFLVGLLFVLAVALSVQPANAQSAPKSFADLAERLLPAVVNISSSQVVRSTQRQERPQAPPGSPFEDFFKEFFDRNQQEGAPRRASSLGSGFIIDKTGFVVTNNHVIADADEITVILQDDSRHKATLIGRDPKTDLALLKIEVDQDLPFVEWGNSAIARVGDWVVAIGNPFGLGGTVTAGIISARHRDINQGPYDSFLQTDASINRGNSGGPMFNMDGQVIGVNTAIFSPTGGSVGVGFSIPSAIAERVVTQLREFGYTKRGWLGVRIQSVTDEIAESLGLDEVSGALVADVTADGPAEKSNIEAGDVILKFDGKMVEQMRDLPRIVAETEIGKPVRVEVWRKNRRRVIDVVVGELKEERPVLASAGPQGKSIEPEEAEIDSLGVSVTAITEQMREQFNVPDDVQGVLVTGVTADSGAAEKGLRPGDVIVEVNQEEVFSPGQIASKVSEAMENDRRSVLLLVNRNGDLRFVAVRVENG
ncbi:MAG: DegQ family serine endoprotease [Proteobacteria bacterium]|nr:MAG: DegQ family serine endoprotease [Pseudomonadota bacterium]